MTKPLYIPATKKVKGLKVHCYACGTTVDGVCKGSGKDIQFCKSGSDHVFKIFAHVPGTSNERRTKTLTGVRDLNEARRLALEFQREIKDEANSVPVVPRSTATKEKQQPTVASDNLAELMARYIGYLHGDPEIAPAFKRKKRSPETLKEMERTFLRLATAAKENDRDVSTMSINDIDDALIGSFYEYLTEELELGNAGYNRAITNMTSFYNYLVNEGFTSRNPFTSLIRKPTKENVMTMEEHQFKALTEILQDQERGIHTLSNGVKKNYYKPWMKDAVELALYTGRRREEILRMKWKDITEDGIMVPDYKVIRQKGLLSKEDDWIYRIVPLTSELRGLLDRLRSNDMQLDQFILAPGETMDRDSMRNLMSKSFAHYYAQLGYSKRLKFGCLRKTYISGLAAAVGLSNARAISGHSGTEVMQRHYTSKKILAAAAKDFSVYQSEDQNEIEIEDKKGREKGLSR